MVVGHWIVLCTLLSIGSCAVDLAFPPGLLLGAGTSAYQIEGAWNVSGKTESIWDTYIHNHPELVRNRSNGDVACDSYNQWQRDVDVAAELGLDFYRFSISWNRILPTAFPDRINEDGKIYYNNLINGLLEKGIQPVVTIYHWDLPQRLQDLGGWANPLISDWYAEYSRVLFSLYADRVNTWITINEPYIMCDCGYGNFFAPYVDDVEYGRYICSKNALLAHAKAWRIYDEEFRPCYNGKISITNHIVWIEPKNENEKEAAELGVQMIIGRYTHPIFSKAGGWPPALRDAIAKRSEEQGYPFSRLPDFTEEEIELIKGTYDFFGINYYTARLARKQTDADDKTFMILSTEPDVDLVYETDPKWKSTASFWFKQYPEGLRRVMQWAVKEYGKLDMLITEVGFSTNSESLNDYDRIQFYKSYMEQMLLAAKEDNIQVNGFTAWSLMDNFEWLDGYNSKFGLYSVNFTDPKRPLTPRMSAKFYAAIIKKRSLDVPDIYNIVE